MFNKFEMIGAGISVFFMGAALYLVQVENTLSRAGVAGQSAAIVSAEPDVVIVDQSLDTNQSRANAYLDAVDTQGNFDRMVIDDVKIGTGEAVQEGDTVEVHYIGTLQNGQEFDNSHKRGVPFTFTVGAGQVIPGWEQGLVGMKVGGQRMLVIPPDLAYGAQGIGPIPGNATLVFAIELLAIK